MNDFLVAFRRSIDCSSFFLSLCLLPLHSNSNTKKIARDLQVRCTNSRLVVLCSQSAGEKGKTKGKKRCFFLLLLLFQDEKKKLNLNLFSTSSRPRQLEIGPGAPPPAHAGLGRSGHLERRRRCDLRSRGQGAGEEGPLRGIREREKKKGSEKERDLETFSSFLFSLLFSFSSRPAGLPCFRLFSHALPSCTTTAFD